MANDRRLGVSNWCEASRARGWGGELGAISDVFGEGEAEGGILGHSLLRKLFADSRLYPPSPASKKRIVKSEI